MRLLILGGSGQLGTELGTLKCPQGIELIAPTRASIDLLDSAEIRRSIAAEPWSVVINAAGYTNVERAESEEKLAFAINADRMLGLGNRQARNSAHSHLNRLCF